MTITATSPGNTPGFSYRLDIWFSRDGRGREMAWYWSYRAIRAIRLPLADAKLFIAQDQANQVAGHPFRPLP